MTRAIFFAAAAILALAAAFAASAQQAPCNPAVEYCLPVPPEDPPEGDG